MAEKTMKIYSSLDAGGGRVVRVVTVPSLDRVQAQAIWGIPDWSRRQAEIEEPTWT